MNILPSHTWICFGEVAWNRKKNYPISSTFDFPQRPFSVQSKHLLSVCLKMHFGIILTHLKVSISVVFIQPCRDSAPCGPVWEFSLTPRVLRCFGVLVFYRLPSLSSRQNPCGGQKGLILSLPCQRGSSCDHFDSFSVFEPIEPGRSHKQTQFCVMFFLLLLEEFLEGAPEASFLLLPTPLAEGGVVTKVTLLCPASPLCLVPWLESRVLVTLNTIQF